MKFSILIPLEEHRGIAVRCIAAWAQGQSAGRESFEILVAAPASHDPGEIEAIRSLLAPQDRILTCPEEHDMPLVAAAAKEARGEILIFTESHCLPRPDFLEQSLNVLAEHPEWAGFSGRSIPLSHNLLSEIEAEMYSRDIDDLAAHHPWMKVLDQCFVIWRKTYDVSGGVEPEFGHFAEWVLAARLHHAGLVIGYDPRAAIEHYYCGDLDELEAFTLDFCAGQMRFAQQAALDPCGKLFDDIVAWNARHEYDRNVARQMTHLLLSDAWHSLLARCGLGGDLVSHKWPWRTARSWLIRCFVRPSWQLRSLDRKRRRLRRETLRQLALGDRAAARAAFRREMAMWVKRGHLQHFAQALAQGKIPPLASQTHEQSEWLVDASSQPVVGLHGLENYQGESFRWSEPAVLFQLPALRGDWHVRLHWVSELIPRDAAETRFYLDEQLIPREAIEHQAASTLVRLYGLEGRRVRLGWVHGQSIRDADSRSLALPLTKIVWQEAPRTSAVSRPHFLKKLSKRKGTGSFS